MRWNLKRFAAGKLPYPRMILIGLSVVSFICVSVLLLNRWEDRVSRFPEQETESGILTYNGVDYVLNDRIETFLVIGLDQFDEAGEVDSYNNDKRADFLMLFVLDNETKQYTAIHINRDTMVDINVLGVTGNKIGTVRGQISLSHTYGNGREQSCYNTANSVSSLLRGVKVNHYISLEMDAVAAINDLVGGVEVEVLDDFTGIDETLIKGETVTLRGDQALTYVRSRQGLDDSSNAARMKRQQQYFTALHSAFSRCVESDQDFVTTAPLEISEYMVSDRSVTQLQVLLDKLGDYNFSGIREIDGQSIAGEQFMEFHSNETAVIELVIDLFYKPQK